MCPGRRRPGSGKGRKLKTPGIQRPKRRKRRNQANKPPLCQTQALGEGTGERHSHSQNECPLVHLTCAPTHGTHAPHRNKPVFGFQEDGTAVDSDAEEKIHELQGAGGGVTPLPFTISTNPGGKPVGMEPHITEHTGTSTKVRV